jgi:hypothetical protein
MKAHPRPLPLADIAARLTPPDRACLDTLARLRVASASQLYRLCYAGMQPRSRERALARLSRWHLIRRLDRKIGGTPFGGSTPYVYGLDLVGQRLLDARGPAGSERRRRPWTPSGPFLRHAVFVSETYVMAMEAARGYPPLRVATFDAEPDCYRQCRELAGGYLKPDAFLVIRATEYEDSFFLEVDCATESPRAIQRKLDAYTTYFRSGREQKAHGIFPLVLFVVPDDSRATQLQALIDTQPAPVQQLFSVVTLALFPQLLCGATDD